MNATCCVHALTLVMMSGSPCSSPPFSVNPQGAPPLNWTWMWWKETSCSTVSILSPSAPFVSALLLLLPPLLLRLLLLLPLFSLAVSRPWTGLLLALAVPAAVPRLLHHRSNNNNEWMDGGVEGRSEWVGERGREESLGECQAHRRRRHFVGRNFRSRCLALMKSTS